MTHRVIENVERYWRGLIRPGELAPRHGDFDILDVPPDLWPSVTKVAVEHGRTLRFRFVVFGGANVRAYGDDLTGRYLDEVDVGGNNDKYAGQFAEAVTERRPVYETDSYVREDVNTYAFEGGCYPLIGEDGRVSHLVLATALYRNNLPYSS
jgi:hypothetical protein